MAGSNAGAPVSAATVTPLDNYYTMLGCYYNFASEAESDMEQMLGWLSGYTLKGASLATFAMSCMSGLSESERNSVNSAYSMAVDEINAHDDLHETESGKQWSFVVNNVISPVELEVQYMPMYLTVKGTDTRFNDTDIINLTNLQIIRNRWNRLYQAKVVTASTFSDYLVGAGLISDRMKSGYVLTDQPALSNVPTDNSVTVSCTRVVSGSWFKKGQSYSIGTSGKYSAKYFDTRYQLADGQAYKLDDGSTISRLAAYVDYFEDHWYWMHSESAIFRFYLTDSYPLVALTIG